MSNVFASEFWRSLYFAGLGGQAAQSSEPGVMAAILTGSGSLTGTLSQTAATAAATRRGGKDDRRRPVVPQYMEWTQARIDAVRKHEQELLAALLDPEEAPPLPVVKTKKITPAQELERINLLMLTALQAAQDDVRRKDWERLRKEAKRNKVAVPDTAEQTRALVVWLAKRAEALRLAEEDDEETILLLAA